jgi:predicted nucleic acid-binding protein
MKGRFFLDTNIIVYALDPSFGEKSQIALRLLREGIKTKQAVISYQVVQEFFNVAFTKFVRPLPLTEAENYLHAVFRPILSVHSSASLVANALRIKIAHQLSWYDALIVSAALQSECQTLYSEDIQSGRILEGLRIENPMQSS